MRQIKFRGQNINGQWVTGNLSILKKDFSSTVKKGYYISNSAGAPFAFMVRPESVGQFTGLLDKNGTEIYEGDVVKFSTRRYHLGRDKGLQTITFKSDVIFDDGCFMISETQKYDTYLYTHSSECQVIGNIHTHLKSNTNETDEA